MLDFTCVCILDAFKNDAASKAMERVLKLVSENRAKEIMKVCDFCMRRELHIDLNAIIYIHRPRSLVCLLLLLSVPILTHSVLVRHVDSCHLGITD